MLPAPPLLKHFSQLDTAKEAWELTGRPVKERHREEFLNHIRKAFHDDTRLDPEKVVRAVFRVLAERTSAGEIEDVKHMLPRGLQDLWP